MRIPGERDLFHQGKLFLELARDDQWRANILIQLAESVGDQVGALSGYIDMLLAARPGEKYLGWFTELGRLERGARPQIVAR